MGERIETASPPVQPGLGWGLNLTSQRRQRMLLCRLLRVATPFLALGGRHLRQNVATRSPGPLTAIPWLAPRWLEWPERDITSAHAKEPGMRLPQAGTSAVTSPSVSSNPQQQEQPPIALALALQRVCTGLGTPGRGQSNSPALVSPFSMGLRTSASLTPVEAVVHPARTRRETANMGMGSAFPQLRIQPQISSAPSSPTPTEATVHLVRTRRENANMGMGSAFPQPRILPQISSSHSSTTRQKDDLSVTEAKATGKQIVPGAGGKARLPLVSGRSYGPIPSRFPNMTPSWGPLGSFRGLTPGTFPVTFHLIMTLATSGHRAKQAELLLQGSPEAVDAPDMPPLPEHKLHGGLAPGPMPLQGLSLVVETVMHTMKREVAAAIRQREEEAQSPALGRPSGLNMMTAGNLVSDNLVRLFMQKMRKMAEEERFRLGLLR